MSIISSDAKWAVLRRAVRLSPEEIRGTTKSKEYEAGFIAGATRQPTPEYTAKLLGVPLDEVLYIIAHPETPAPTRMISRPNSSNH